MKTPTAYLCALAATLSLVATASAAHRTNSIPPASSFSARVNNPWFPLLPGTRYVYTGVKDGKRSRDVMVVTHATRTIDGISCVAVSDKLYLLGRLEERTTDWYSQDARGNVWYFGERTAELDAHGQVTSTEGTWTAGVAGAQPGIYMPADPSVGQSGRQEYYKGHAEDHFKVIGRFNTVSPRGAANIVLTSETTPLEPGTVDHKMYVRGIGTVLEQTEHGPNERNELVSVTRTP
ncbi:MAG: hypothetical protein WCF27_14440 [Gaiellaceae bacterium]